MNTPLTIAYCRACDRRSDMHQHVPRLRALASQCRHVTEFGVRYGVSSVGLLAGLPLEYVGYDLQKKPPKRLAALAESNGIGYAHVRQNTLAADPIDPTDLLLIDTKHTYAQVSGELARHAHQVRKFLVFHDTETYGDTGEDGGPGINQAIEDFLTEHPAWNWLEHFDNNHGLTIFEKTA